MVDIKGTLYYTAEEVARIFDVKPVTVSAWVRYGSIPFTRLEDDPTPYFTQGQVDSKWVTRKPKNGVAAGMNVKPSHAVDGEELALWLERFRWKKYKRSGVWSLRAGLFKIKPYEKSGEQWLCFIARHAVFCMPIAELRFRSCFRQMTLYDRVSDITITIDEREMRIRGRVSA